MGAGLCAAFPPSVHAADAHATRIGAAPPSAALQIVLPLRINATGLRKLALTVSDPHSSLYGRYESVASLSRRFGAAPATRARVEDFLRSQGATDVKVDATGLLAEATVSAALAQRLFETPLTRFRATDGTRYVAPSSSPAVPAALQGLAEGVVGLDTHPLSTRSDFARRVRAGSVGAGRPGYGPRAQAAASQPPSDQPRTGTPAGCPQGTLAGEQAGISATAAFTPNQYLIAYGFTSLQNAGDTGQGERVALIEIDGFNGSDITTFAQCFGLALPRVSAFGVGVRKLLPPGGEATLDLELLDAAAPGLNGIDVYETKSDPAGLLKALVAPLEVKSRKPQVVSASLGLCEQALNAAGGSSGVAVAERVLQLATATGVSYLAASGDQGSADCTDSSGAPRHRLGVNYPASSWWVTGVGGTNIVLNAANQITSQIVWNDTTQQLAAGGGGLSELFVRPYYQRRLVRSDSRGVPDVSMLADLTPGYAIYCTSPSDCLSVTNPSPWLSVGGTSAATPLLAGGVALIDQQLRNSGRADVGFANPLLYMLGGSGALSSVFSDVTAIGNDVGPYLPSGNGRPLGCCTAKAGYDLASGWGSVDIARFAQHAVGLLPYILGAIKLSIPGHQDPAAHHQILASVTCARACFMAAFAKLQIGHKSFIVDSGIVNRPRGGRKTLALVFSKAQRRLIAAALSAHHGVFATIYGVIVDPRGLIQRQTAGRRLEIKR